MKFSDRIKLYDTLFPIGLFILSVPFAVFIVIGALRADILFMGIGAVLSGIPILMDFFKVPIRSKFLVEPMINNSIHKMRLLMEDISPKNYDLNDAVSAIRGTHLGDDIRYVREKDLEFSEYREVSYELVKKLIEYPHIQKLFILEAAITEDVIEISPMTYMNETRPYLLDMETMLQGSFDDYVYKDSLYKVKKEYVEGKKELVGQLNYNVQELYKIARARKFEEYGRKFEEVMGDSWVQNKPEN